MLCCAATKGIQLQRNWTTLIAVVIRLVGAFDGHADVVGLLLGELGELDADFGEMEAGDFAKVRAHLDACAECLRQYDLDHMVKLMVKRSCAPEPAPTNLRATIVSRLTVIRIETAD